MSDQAAATQLLHLVFGGELTDLDGVEFRDLESWTSSASIPTTPPPMSPGRRRRSRPSTMPTCATSSCICTGCSIRKRISAASADADAVRADVVGQACRGLAPVPEDGRGRGGRIPSSGMEDDPVRDRAGRHLRAVRPRRAGDHRHVARPAFPDSVHPARRGSRQGADLAPSRRRGQCAGRAASRRRHHPRLRPSQRRLHRQGRRERLQGDARARWTRATTSRSPPTFPRSRGSPGSASSSSRARRAGRSIRSRSRPGGASSSTTGTAPRSTFRSAAAAGVAGEPVRVPPDADGATLEAARRALEARARRGDRARLRHRRPAARRAQSCLSACRSRCTPIAC